MFFSLSTIGQTVNKEIKNNPLEILVYPNPMLDQCWLKADEGSNCELINSLGELIQSWTMDSKKSFLITDLKTCFYQLSIDLKLSSPSIPLQRGKTKKRLQNAALK